jgi:hypothetical protein
LLKILLIFSYLTLPLCFFIAKGKIKEGLLLLLALYGLVFFSFLFFDESIPKDIKKYSQAIYTFLEYSAFTYIFWVNIKNKLFRKFIIIVTVLFVLFQIYYVTNTGLQRLDSIPIGIETILIFIYIFFFFFDFAKNIKDIFIYNHYCFWLSVGILIYLGGSFFYYILVNHLEKEDVDKFGNFTYVAEIIKNLLFCISIFMYKKIPVNKIHNHSKNIPHLDMI